jgi:LPXTG-motif cell wall-anchored protein
MPVGHRLRTTAITLGLVVLASLGLIAVAAGAAGAQQTTPSTPSTYTVNPVTLPPGGGNVTVQGTAPGSSVIRVYAGGVFITAVGTDPVDGSFSVTFHLDQTAEVAITIDDYPATGCGLSPEQANINANRGSLPRTGGAHIESTVLLGLALVLVGAVLVVGLRRHDTVRGRRTRRS